MPETSKGRPYLGITHACMVVMVCRSLHHHLATGSILTRSSHQERTTVPMSRVISYAKLVEAILVVVLNTQHRHVKCVC